MNERTYSQQTSDPAAFPGAVQHESSAPTPPPLWASQIPESQAPRWQAAPADPAPRGCDRIPPSDPTPSSGALLESAAPTSLQAVEGVVIGQKKRRRWPWALLGGALGLVAGVALGIGGTTAVLSGAHQQVWDGLSGGSGAYGSDPSGEDPYSWYYPYSHDFLGGGAEDSSSSQDLSQTLFTYADVLAALPDVEGTVEDVPGTDLVACTAGAYQVGTLSGIPAGIYFLEGSDTQESTYFLFKAVSGRADPQKARYAYYGQNTYLGNYFLSLSDGDLLVYLPADSDDAMYDASLAEVDAGSVLTSGFYRVGVDIPEGTYHVELDPDLAGSISLEAGAYVMSERTFPDGTFADERYVTVGSNQTVTVRNGDWLELYGATAELEQ